MAGIASIGYSPVELRVAEDGAMNNQTSQGEEQNQTLQTEKKQKEADTGNEHKPEM